MSIPHRILPGGTFIPRLLLRTLCPALDPCLFMIAVIIVNHSWSGSPLFRPFTPFLWDSPSYVLMPIHPYVV